jgi:uncharacterized protein (TIGR02453 family)
MKGSTRPSPDQAFAGFPPEGFRFFKQIATHNNREWFQAHTDVYEQQCRAPMQALAEALEPKYGAFKISRINRDLRFSPNRAPYKTYIAAGVGGHYISFSADGVWVGGGMYRPEPAALQRYRKGVDDAASGKKLERIVGKLRDEGYDIGAHERLTSVPRGYRDDHPRLDLLQMKGIYAGRMFEPSGWLSSARALERIERAMADTAPLIAWLNSYAGGAMG